MTAEIFDRALVQKYRAMMEQPSTARGPIRPPVPTMTLERLRVLDHTAKIDHVNEHTYSHQGFRTTMRVTSDRPSKTERWSAGMSVSWQTVRADAKTYKQRMASTAPLPKPHVPLVCWRGEVRPTHHVRQVHRPVDAVVNPSRGTGTLAARIFG